MSRRWFAVVAAISMGPCAVAVVLSRWEGFSPLLIVILFIPPMLWAIRYPISVSMMALLWATCGLWAITAFVCVWFALYSDTHPFWVGIYGLSPRYHLVFDSGNLGFATDGGWDTPWWISLRQVARNWAVFAFLSAMLLVPGRMRLARQHRRTKAGLCTRCGYNLTGNTSGICPECGTPVAKAPAGESRRSG